MRRGGTGIVSFIRFIELVIKNAGALTQSSHADLADAFITYVLSDDGQAVLEKWGF